MLPLLVSQRAGGRRNKRLFTYLDKDRFFAIEDAFVPCTTSPKETEPTDLAKQVMEVRRRKAVESAATSQSVKQQRYAWLCSTLYLDCQHFQLTTWSLNKCNTLWNKIFVYLRLEIVLQRSDVFHFLPFFMRGAALWLLHAERCNFCRGRTVAGMKLVEEKPTDEFQQNRHAATTPMHTMVIMADLNPEGQ